MTRHHSGRRCLQSECPYVRPTTTATRTDAPARTPAGTRERAATEGRTMERANKTFVKTIKRGKAVQKVRREHYLRDDVYVGHEAAEERYRGKDPAAWVLRPERRKTTGKEG